MKPNNIFCISILPSSLILLLPICPTSQTDELGEPFLPEELQIGYQVGLKLHNLYRAWHHSPPMILDDGLNKESQKWANHLVVLGKMQHDYSSRTGENVFHTWHKAHTRPNTTYLAERAVKYWYFELCDPKQWPKDHPNHFTQLVWKSSVRLGLGFSANVNNTQYYVVARYLAAGNYPDDPIFSANVPPVRCHQSAICDGNHGRYNLQEEQDCEGSNEPPEAAPEHRDHAGRSKSLPDKDNDQSTSKASGYAGKGGFIWTLIISFIMNMNF